MPVSNVPPVMTSDIKAIRHQQGFTLVEIIIALVVLSLISLGTLTAMRTLADTQAKLNVTVERVDEMRQVSRFLRNSLRQAMLPPSSGGVGVGIWAELGRVGRGILRHEPDELVWLGPLDSVGGLPGLNYMRLYHNRGEQALRLQITPYHNDLESIDWNLREEGYLLAGSVDEFELAYRMEENEDWVRSLVVNENETEDVPAAIRINIRAQERYWPEIIVAPHQGGRQ